MNDNDHLKRRKDLMDGFDENEQDYVKDVEEPFDYDRDLFEMDERFATDDLVADGAIEEEELRPSKWGKWIKIGIATIVSIAMLTNILAFWPHVYSLAAIQFIRQSTALSSMEEIQLIKEAVVVIKAGDRKGTGFFISEDGWIITNEHVVGEEQEVSVGLFGGQHGMAKVVGTDQRLDIALIKTEAQGNWPILPLEEQFDEWMADERSMTEPIEAVFVGNPLFFNRIANEGVVFSFVPNDERSLPLLIIRAPIFKGHSGSPLLNKQGKVIGVVFATTQANIEGQKEKVGLAVPVSLIDDFIAQNMTADGNSS